jgi:diguanylate cyclase (GGDEF)-like protein
MPAHNHEFLELELEQLFASETKSSSMNRKPLAFKARRNPAERDLEGMLTSALLAGDKELDRVVHELEEISKVLRTGASGIESNASLHPAVWTAVRQVLLERELRHLALSDDLTCLYNRRGFYAAATQQLKLALRHKKAALLLFCDVDWLKTINDTYGHREGDFALVRTADALEEVFRDSDVLARLSGDEFAVLAADFSREHQQAILNRLQKSLRKASKEEFRYELSLSVGAAWFDPENPVSLGELMEQADRAMYEEKRKRFAVPQREGASIQKNNTGGRPDAFALAKRKI